jgi:hypothetical protein
MVYEGLTSRSGDLASDIRPTESTANIPSELPSAIANTNEVEKPDRTATVGAADTVVPTMAFSVMLRVKPDMTATVGAADTVVPTMAFSVMLRVKPDRTATVGAADTVVPTMACSVMLRVMAAPEVSNTSE